MERSRPTTASSYAEPENAAATTKDSAAEENAAAFFETTKDRERGSERRRGGGLQSAALKPSARPRSATPTPGTSTPISMMEESVDRSVDRQRWSPKNSKLMVACFAVSILMLFVVSAIVLYKYVVQPEMLVAESNKSKNARVGSAIKISRPSAMERD